MSASTVSIRRLSATAHLGPDGGDSARIARLLGGVAARRLDGALRSVPLPPGIWCLRRLDVPVRLDLDAPDPVLEQAWAAAVAAAVARALRARERAVRYSGMRDALADLVAGVASARLDRAWAWAQLDLLRPSDPDARAAPREALLAAVNRRPRHVAGAVVLAVERGGLAPLHRCLGAVGWAVLARTVAGRLQFGALPAHDSRSSAELAARLVASSRFAWAVRRCALRPTPATIDAWAVLVAAEVDPSVLRRATGPAVLAAIAATLSQHSGRLSGIGVPPTPAEDHNGGTGAADGPAVFGVAPPDVRQAATTPPEPPVPAGMPVGAAGQTLSGVARSPALHAQDPPDSPAKTQAEAQRAETPLAETQAEAPQPGVGDRSAHAPVLGPVEARPTGGPYAAEADPPLAQPDFPADEPDLPGAADGLHPTAYAGLLFLIATAAAAGVPDVVLDDPVFAAQSLPWVLHGVARRLGVPASDPAAATFAGFDPGLGLPWLGEQPANPDELDAVSIVANRWSRVTAAALSRDDVPPDEVVAAVIRRCGLIAYAPGWVEVRMPLTAVDIDIRRAGLDLDPGWVPWLGVVVRYRYE